MATDCFDCGTEKMEFDSRPSQTKRHIEKMAKTRNSNQPIKAIRELKGSFTSEETLALVVDQFIRVNEVAERTTHRGQIAETLQYLPKASDGVRNLLSWVLELKDVERAFEILIDLDRKKAEGVVYTPDYIIDFIVERALRKVGQCRRLIDPACGAGGFSIRAAQAIASREKISLSKAISNHIYGCDINAEAVSCAKLLLELLLLKHADTGRITPSNFRQADTLLPNASAREFLDIKFDVVVSNPPYVKLQNLDESYADQLKQKYASIANGSFSLAMLFLYRGFQLLSETGYLGYITQNNLYTSIAAKQLREYLAEKRCVEAVIDFGHKQVFTNASAYTCLVFLQKTESSSFSYAQVLAPEENLIQSKIRFSDINYAALDPVKWRLGSQDELENLKKIESCGTSLGELADIRVGFATLKDAVFLLNASETADLEPSILRPAYKIAELESAACLKTKQSYVIFPYHKKGNKWSLYSLKEMETRFPSALRYLKSHESDLLDRSSHKDSDEPFYAWGRIQGMEAMGPKLLTKTFNKGPLFIRDNSDALFCNGYGIQLSAEASLFAPNVDLDTLSVLLNSCVMDYYAKMTSFQIEGDYQCFQKNFIEKFGIPMVSAKEEKQLKTLKGAELDQLVCGLYGINLQEIRSVIARL